MPTFLTYVAFSSFFLFFSFLFFFLRLRLAIGLLVSPSLLWARGNAEFRQCSPSSVQAVRPGTSARTAASATPDSYCTADQIKSGCGAASVATRRITARLLALSLPQAKQRQGTELCESCQCRDVTCHLSAWPIPT
ncbi:hypothetical protein M441DRAFT_341711 [Trichoderma asperellum CBS 433.97]|uniref:Uncharacterized protein n=1 Tax=Trichoderma asperellum (strain ATCC 204424 / CBS 433.97 / NBRC 101777) TaxID=1042311 RepID=A0A2T3ZH29_TRIA4|nr:hypothetical protein M441DRAFT_341711 [Trichoderma asperellum CBS 433.97]PTB44102.1 hypothetical protein M441DRAFT_341711 [Trichoderma asperellum CBS 433.97]